MNKTETKRFNSLYERHLKLLKLQGKSPSTIGNYARAVRRIVQYFDCCPDQLTQDQMEDYFSQFLETHSWSQTSLIEKPAKRQMSVWQASH
jgi:integrase/recombinase XerD